MISILTSVWRDPLSRTMDGIRCLLLIPVLLQYKVSAVDFFCNNMDLDQIPVDIPSNTTRIRCSNNRISEILLVELDGLHLLNSIDLGGNKFSEFPDLSQHGNLTSLALHRNPLTKESFHNFFLPYNLAKLDLRDNQLTELPVICQFKDSLRIDLRFNPIICDVKIAWLLTLGFVVTGTCDSPEQVSGREISSLSYADLQITLGK